MKACVYIYLVLLIFTLCPTLARAQNSTFIKGSSLYESVTSIASSGGSTSLTVSSNTNIRITGVLAHTINFPAATTLLDGRVYTFVNKSTGSVVIRDGAAATLTTLLPNEWAIFKLFDNSTAAGVWISTIPYTLPVARGGTNSSAALANNLVMISSAGAIVESTVTTTELGYLTGVTSSIQTQLNNKQPLDATLTALAAYNTNGLLTQTAADTFTGRTITAGSSKINIANGNGVSGNPSVDVIEGNLTLDSIGGTLGILKGGTGQTTSAGAFGVLSPLTTKGDILGYDTGNNRVPIGTNGQALVADSTAALGLKWASVGSVTSVTAGTGLNVGAGPGGTITSTGTLNLANTAVTAGSYTRSSITVDAQGRLTAASSGAAISLTADVSGILPLANGGTNNSAAASAGSVVFSNSTQYAFTAVGTTNQVLQSAGTGTPTWSTATYPPTTTANQILYSSAANTVGQITTAATSALVTNSSSVPAFTSGTTANRLLRTDGTTISFAQANLTTDVTGALPIGNGGTGQTTKAAAFDALSPMTTGGDLIYGGASGTGTRLANGSAGQRLQSNGTTAAPTWTYPSATTQSTTYTALNTDETIFANTGSAFTISFPGSSTITGKIYHFVVTGANQATLDPNSTETICGQTTIKLEPNDSASFVADGSNWQGVNGGCYFRGGVRIAGGTATSTCTGTCTAYNPNPSTWLTATRNSSGLYTMTFTSGTFSGIPTCNFTGAGTDSIALRIESISSSSVQVSTRNPTSLADAAFDMQCSGPR